jgi:integrase
MARKRRKRPAGQGCVWQRGPGNFWIRWREKGRLRSRGGYATFDEAEKILALVTANVRAERDGMPTDPRRGPTLDEIGKSWLKRRDSTHRSASDDRSRWRCHLEPFFGRCKPADVDAALIRQFVEEKLAAGLSSTTVGHMVRLLSTMFADAVENGHVAANPVSTLPRTTRRLYRNAHDPKDTPFLERTEDIRSVFLKLPEPTNVAFAVGALAGLRTGEVLGLPWRDVDLANRRIIVRQQVSNGKLGPLKDDDSRVVPILKPLAPILAAWKLTTGGQGMLFAPKYAKRGGRPDIGSPPMFMRPNTLAEHLQKAFKQCKLPPLTWYQATRHTFASQWVLGGGTIELLSKVMGHASITTTERYSHLRPDLFRESAFDVVKVDLSPATGDVVSLKADSGPGDHAVITEPKSEPEKKPASS